MAVVGQRGRVKDVVLNNPSPQKPPPLEQRRKSPVGGGVAPTGARTSNTSSPSVHENLVLLASLWMKKRHGGGVAGCEAVAATGNMAGG
jgi:hypothetical protein